MLNKIIFVSACALSSVALAKPEIIISAKLTVGSFKAVSTDVEGFATGNAKEIKAKGIKVSASSFKSPVDLRDQHMSEKYLESGKFPFIELVEASGKNGKGKGKLKVKGIEKEVSGTYKVQGNEVIAEFPVKVSDFKIEGVRYMGIGLKDELKIEARVPLKNQK